MHRNPASQKRKSFADTLRETAAENSRRVAERAGLANGIAKTAGTFAARRAAYDVKTRALRHAIAAFPADYALVSSERDGALIAVRHRDGLCVHFPVDPNGAEHTWLVTERTRILKQWHEIVEAA